MASDNHSPDSNQPLDQLLVGLYEQLRLMAANSMRAERPNHTLQPTALVHEAYLRLAKQEKSRWTSRTQFLSSAAGMMRRILVDHARSKAAQKRGGAAERVSLTGELLGKHDACIGLLEIDNVLTRLAEIDKRQARVVELRFFGGMTNEETADALEISLATVKREWTHARLWLLRELADQG